MLAFALNASNSIIQVGATANEIVSTSAIGDLLAVSLILVIMILYGFLFDPNNMLTSLFSIYAGYLITLLFHFSFLSSLEGWLSKLILFLIIVVISYITLSASRLFRIVFIKNFFARWFKSGLTGILHGGLLISIILSLLPANILSQFSSNFLKIFISDLAVFLWFTIPLLAVWLIRSKRRARSTY